MKGILLSLASFAFLLLASIFSVRAYRGKKYFYLFLAELPFACLLYGLLSYHLPDDLGFLPAVLLEFSRPVDFTNGLLILLLLFHLMWNAGYAFVFTGFTSELFVRLSRQKGNDFSIHTLMEEFGSDRPLDDILTWRLPNLLRSNYVSAEGDSFRLTGRGRFMARAALFLKTLFSMDVEG